MQVFTRTPIREPYLNFLVEIDWPKGHLLREYTLLLDPPVYNTGANSTTSSSGSSESYHPFIEPTDDQAQPQSGNSQPVYNQTSQSNTRANTAQGVNTGNGIQSGAGNNVNYQYQYQAMPSATSAAGQYRVQKNDTLWSIASRMRPDSSVSVEQMMLALVRKNPEAFINENINGVKRGYILRAPSRDEATQISRQEAVAEARDHSSLWREYSQASSQAAPASSLEADDQAMQPADKPTRDTQGQLSILGANENNSSDYAGSNQDPSAQLTQLKQDLAVAREQLESTRLEKDDLQARLADLEQRVQRVIEMDDSELAKLQQDLQQTSDTAVSETAPAEPVIDPLAEGLGSELEIAEEPDAEQEPVQDVMDESDDEAISPLDSNAVEEPVFVDETDGSEQDEVLEDSAADMAESTQQSANSTLEKIEPPAFAQTKPASFIDNLLKNPMLMGIVAGGMALLALLLALLLKLLRGRKADKDEWDSALDDDASNFVLTDDDTVHTEVSDMLETAEMQVDEDVTRVKPVKNSADDLEDTVFSLDDGDETPPEADKDDVLAEADVYLAYGIYQQAEDLLGRAIDENPERDDYRMKLLETHFAAKNASGFEQLAGELQATKGSDASFWNRVAAMGMELCPTSPVFAGAKEMLAGMDTDALIPEKPVATDLQLDPGMNVPDGMDLGGLDELGLDDSFDGSLDTHTGMDLDADLDGGLDASLDSDLDTGLDLADAGESATDDLGSMDLESHLQTLSGEMDLGLDDLEADTASVDMTDEADDLSLDSDLDAGLDLGDDLGEDLSAGLDMTEDDMSVGLELSLDDTDVAAPASDSLDDDVSGGLDIDDDFSLDFEASDLGFEEGDDELDSAAASLDDSADTSLDSSLDLGIDLADDDDGLDLTDDLTGDLADDLSLDMSDDLGGEMDLSDDGLSLDDDLSLDTAEVDLSDDMDGGLELDDSALDLSDAMPNDAAEELLDMDDSDFDISELSEDVDEVSTKLDLAKAYIDMGDSDGARSILEEVKVEGNNDQQQQAEALMQQAS